MADKMYDGLVSKFTSDLSHSDRVLLHVNHARLFLKMQKYDSARAALNHAHNLFEYVGKDTPCYFAYMLVKGQLHRHQRELSEAETTLSTAADGIERLYGSRDIRFTEAAIALAEVHIDKGNKDTASMVISRIKIDEEKQFGMAHPLVVKLQALKEHQPGKCTPCTPRKLAQPD